RGAERARAAARTGARSTAAHGRGAARRNRQTSDAAGRAAEGGGREAQALERGGNVAFQRIQGAVRRSAEAQQPELPAARDGFTRKIPRNGQGRAGGAPQGRGLAGGADQGVAAESRRQARRNG